MALKRRAFLQAGGAIAAFGLSELLLGRFTDRYQQALAQPARRKLALLIGINQYPETVCDYSPARGTALTGCLTDVELQAELLRHRFGFQSSDILMLTDQAATRQGITDAFRHHLIEQSSPGDLVVFHFSGLGSQIRIDGAGDAAQSSLVPIDGFLPTAETPMIHDFLQETLGLLLSALPTNQVITVIDAGYSRVGRTMQGNLRIRSRPDSPVGLICAAELDLQEELIRQTRLSRDQIRQRWQTGQLPGTLLQAGSFDRIVTEAQWSGFSAGLFTAALTQQLWSTTPTTPIWVSFQQSATALRQTVGNQQPSLGGPIAAGLPGLNPVSADGVIRSVEEDGKAQVWLAGFPTPVLENASLLWCAVSDPQSSPPADPATLPPLIQIRSREGLIGRSRGGRSGSAASSVGSTAGPLRLAPGQLIQEMVRVLPRNLGLTVAIDGELARIERVDATSAFAAMPRVSSVIAGEQPADLLFGKTHTASLIAAAPPQTASSSDAAKPSTQDAPLPTPNLPNLPTETASRYGLFSPGRTAIPNTLIPTPEAVKSAINRMTPQLKTLLALKLLRLTQNPGSSQLGVRVLLETTTPARLIASQTTIRRPLPPTPRLTFPPIDSPTATLPVGSQIRYRLQNYSDQPLYFLLIGIDTRGNPLLFAPPATSPNPDATRPALAPQEILTLPLDREGWSVQRPIGLAETHLIFSCQPFHQTEQILKGHTSQITDSLETIQAILQDLHQASTPLIANLEIPPDSYALDVRAWATLSFVYQVVEG